MGGHIFRRTAQLSAEDVEKLVLNLPKFMKSLGLLEFTVIGSLGSGIYDSNPNDIDVAVVISDVIKSYKLPPDTQLYDALAAIGERCKKLGIPYKINKGFSMVSVEYSVDNLFIQLDIIVNLDKKLAEFSFAYKRGKYKHVYRNLLLGAIVHTATVQNPPDDYDTYRYSFNLIRGLAIKNSAGEIVQYVTRDPDEIIRLIFPFPVRKSQLNNFEDLLEILKKFPPERRKKTLEIFQQSLKKQKLELPYGTPLF